MLVELHIENLGVIERASLVFGDALTALTGETGAGKTMLVEAIELLVGGRADPSIVRGGAAEARVDGRIVVPGADDEVVVSRVVPASGRSRAYIDGRPATVSALAELSDSVIDLHGQHAHQTLLDAAAQRAALDGFGHVDLGPLRAARARLTELDAELATLGGDERARAREIDLLRFQVGELDAAAISDPSEDEALASTESLLSDAVAHREAAATALSALRDERGADEALSSALQALSERQPFGDIAGRLRGLVAELDDIVAELRARGDSIEEDPARLDEVRVRRQLLRDLRRKYGDDLGEVMAFHAEAEARLRELEQYDERAAELDAQRAEALRAERRAAHAVRAARRAAAPVLATAIERRLRELAMPDASVAIEVGLRDDDHPGDEVRFLLSANPGSAMLPLNRVASGGELARTMLALRLVLVGAGTGDAPSTLVFDEVDAGIGGGAAAAVGAALADLGEHHQVLVVTHLPQVAAAARCQMAVSKAVRGDATFATVDSVDGDDRVAELARMLAGAETEAALEHARQLLTAPTAPSPSRRARTRG
ncbi:MAG: DNA repair protein RecN [Ilumatobacter sp.]|uniref:DNA repair protein RecN n=1 Tax=Ilumatobacter sp. TaxID=1967498 RepID=UPI002626A205|nr:DNA repair protein RecN [Ilumatobacter sp.]MDJ0771261.1 DNA repair protein RecN [Ilumatobacter sp.]